MRIIYAEPAKVHQDMAMVQLLAQQLSRRVAAPLCGLELGGGALSTVQRQRCLYMGASRLALTTVRTWLALPSARLNSWVRIRQSTWSSHKVGWHRCSSASQAAAGAQQSEDLRPGAWASGGPPTRQLAACRWPAWARPPSRLTRPLLVFSSRLHRLSSSKTSCRSSTCTAGG